VEIKDDTAGSGGSDIHHGAGIEPGPLLSARFTASPPLPDWATFVADVVTVAELAGGDSPRFGGLNSAHVKALVGAEWPLPPILVHRSTMRIIDGFHRVAAAVQKKIDKLDAYLIESPLDAAFVIAVQANIAHGLPLSLAERRAAAAKILKTHSEWSDRMIASSVGLSAKMVSGLRCASDDVAQLNKRLGKDGRVRPLNPEEGRLRAAELLSATPSASLRTIANAAGVSPGTVRDVRARLQRGDDPVCGPSGKGRDITRGDSSPAQSSVTTEMVELHDVDAVLIVLSRDPAVRMSETGRNLLRRLHLRAVSKMDSFAIVTETPVHCVPHIVEFARRCSKNWAAIADDLAAHHKRLDESEVAATIRMA
jgi:hypothetical protein